ILYTLYICSDMLVRVLSIALTFIFFFSSYVPLPYLHSFPTRRSSDLTSVSFLLTSTEETLKKYPFLFSLTVTYTLVDTKVVVDRSEEHTSELQSRFDLVCRLLLEKKKKKNKHITITLDKLRILL